MERPYVICHMVISLDGKVTGDFLGSPECEKAVEHYYQINRNMKPDGFAFGRVTMEESFTKGWYPDLSGYTAPQGYRWKMDYIPEDFSGFYAVAFDPHGRLGWQGSRIHDEDPGYDRTQVIEVVTEQVDARYLGYLESIGVAYLFAGSEEIDVPLALHKLRRFFGIQLLLLEGGSILNGAFYRAGCIDELSLMEAPITAQPTDKPLFFGGIPEGFGQLREKQLDGALWKRSKRERE